MPSLEHEGPIVLCGNGPSLAGELLERTVQFETPEYAEARVEPGELGDMRATEYRADFVVTFRDAAGKPLLAIVVEVQRCTDYRKKYSWPEYVTKLRSKLECDVILLVICDDPAIAPWSGEPIKIGPPGWCSRPSSSAQAS